MFLRAMLVVIARGSTWLMGKVAVSSALAVCRKRHLHSERLLLGFPLLANMRYRLITSCKEAKDS